MSAGNVFIWGWRWWWWGAVKECNAGSPQPPSPVRLQIGPSFMPIHPNAIVFLQRADNGLLCCRRRRHTRLRKCLRGKGGK